MNERVMIDRVMIGSISGIIGAFVMGIMSIIINLLTISSLKMFFLDSSVFLPKSLASTLAGNIYGFIIHLLIGAIIGIIFMYIFNLTGDDYLFYKGILLGSISWLIIGGIFGNILRLPVKDSLIDNIIFSILNIIFGLITVYSAQYLRKNKSY